MSEATMQTTTIPAEQFFICPMFPLIPLILLDEKTPAYEGTWNGFCLVVQSGFWDHMAKYTTYSD